MKKSGRFALSGSVAVIVLFALTACGGSTTTLGGAETASSEDSVPAAATVTVTVILDLDKDGVITSALELAGEQGWCPVTVGELGKIGQAVNLKVDGIDTPFTGRLKASPSNGDDLPCQVEATIPNVPSGAKLYTATQTGGTSSSVLTGEATVTGTELEANANIINLK